MITLLQVFESQIPHLISTECQQEPRAVDLEIVATECRELR